MKKGGLDEPSTFLSFSLKGVVAVVVVVGGGGGGCWSNDNVIKSRKMIFPIHSKLLSTRSSLLTLPSLNYTFVLQRFIHVFLVGGGTVVNWTIGRCRNTKINILF